MLIRIISLDKLFHKKQGPDFDRYIPTINATAMPGYADRKSRFGVFCGSF